MRSDVFLGEVCIFTARSLYACVSALAFKTTALHDPRWRWGLNVHLQFCFPSIRTPPYTQADIKCVKYCCCWVSGLYLFSLIRHVTSGTTEQIWDSRCRWHCKMRKASCTTLCIHMYVFVASFEIISVIYLFFYLALVSTADMWEPTVQLLTPHGVCVSGWRIFSFFLFFFFFSKIVIIMQKHVFCSYVFLLAFIFLTSTCSFVLPSLHFSLTLKWKC